MASNPGELPPFNYTPLAPGQIRLLVPDTSQTNNGLSWTLQIADLDAGLDYDALSYTWGSQLETFPITCNGLQLRVHHNLYLALPYLARRENKTAVTTQPIWVDAVCINQKDDDEKYIQINMMNQIYKRARKVWAWLGVVPEPDKLSQFLSLLPVVVAYNKQITGLTEESTPERPSELRQIDITFRDTIFHLFQNPWFRRVWVIQEAALARDISYLSGEHEIDFSALGEAIDTQRFRYWMWYDAAGSPVRLPHMSMTYEVLPEIRTFFRSGTIHEGDTAVWRPLRVTLLMIPNLDCFSPRDRVFGMMGLLKEIDPEIPDFQSNTSLPALYTSFSRYILSKSTRNFHWWRYINLSFNLRRTENLPSWVPDLHFQRPPYTCTPGTIREFQRSGDTRYKASLSPSTIKFGFETDEIILQGKILDRITLVHPPNNGLKGFYGSAEHLRNDTDDSNLSAFVNLAEWEQSLANTVLSTSPDEHTSNSTAAARPHVSKDTYWRTLMANNDFDTQPGDMELTQATWDDFRTALRQFAAVIQKIMRLYAAGELSPSGKDDARLLSPEELEIAGSTKLVRGTGHAHLSKLWRLAGRQLFNTAQGRFGFTLRGVRDGDLVAVLNGSQTPHVVRRVADREGGARYRFVGDAYVHGLMNDEAHGLGEEEREMVFV